MSNIGEFFLELNAQGELENYPSMLLVNTVGQEEAARGNLKSELFSNEIYVIGTTVVANGNINIPVGTTFDLIMSNKKMDDYFHASIVLRQVSINKNRNPDHLPGGYYAACLLEFGNAIPELLNRLVINGEDKSPFFESFIITQNEVYERFLRYMQKS